MRPLSTREARAIRAALRATQRTGALVAELARFFGVPESCIESAGAVGVLEREADMPAVLSSKELADPAVLPPEAQEGARQRFVAKVRTDGGDSRGFFDRCWHWTGAKTHQTWFRLSHRHPPTSAERAAWVLWRGLIPPGNVVTHGDCGCVNPRHLRCLTQRAVSATNGAKGARDRRKLSSEDVEAIRAFAPGYGVGRMLSSLFGVAGPTISNIINGKTRQAG